MRRQRRKGCEGGRREVRRAGRSDGRREDRKWRSRLRERVRKRKGGEMLSCEDSHGLIVIACGPS